MDNKVRPEMTIAIPLLEGMTCDNYLNALSGLGARGVIVTGKPDAAAFDEFGANEVSGAFRRDHDGAVAFRKIELSVVNVEPVSRQNDRVGFQIRADLFAEDLTLFFIGKSQDDDIGLFDGFFDRDRLKSGFFRETIVVAVRTLTNNDLAAAVAKVLSVRVTLGTISQNRDYLIFQKRKIRVVVVINCRSHCDTPILLGCNSVA